MAKTLSDRFNETEAQRAWGFQNHCHWCGESGWDSIHHIVSPQSECHKKGSFNASLLNSAPMHNEGCHLYNAELHKPENEKRLLRKTLLLLTTNGYRFTKKDHTFYHIYQHLFEGSGESIKVLSAEPLSSMHPTIKKEVKPNE